MSKRVIRKNYNLYISTVLAFLFVLLMLFSFAYNFYDRWSELADLNLRIAELQPQIKAITLLENKNREIEKKIKEFGQLFQEGYSILDILKELTTIIPDNAWINSLQLRGSKLSISGYSDSPEDLPKILDSSPFFEDVKIVQIVKDKFSIEALVQKAPLVDNIETSQEEIEAKEPSLLDRQSSEPIKLSGRDRKKSEDIESDDIEKTIFYEDSEMDNLGEEIPAQDEPVPPARRPLRSPKELSGQISRGKRE
ncbi:MAG: hypothetical protein A2161_18900 [Candidatus Schekmanbacteria bacterium RBG_13_48_7]|uniref:Fimbrial assembly protein n=1 Tax=Candidatus Schekmanbacteria bacterium RBG_13_48_7 TaxID=1817878 RepID=A0A1F7RU56_9BACT|nr:MAG: hypothetical protein A2161_18900 [Candidatus Schekmanbacteria bacterium RBG_13_48_7]